MYTHPKYKSVTRWRLHKLPVPTSHSSFKATEPERRQLCPCVFKSGHLFQWKIDQAFSDDDVITTNDTTLEELMWMLYDLLMSFDLLKASNGESIYGQIVQTAYKQLIAINEFHWPQRDEDMVRLILNWDKPWGKIPAGSYKIPWYLLPKCNEPLRLFLYAELLVYAQKLRLEKNDLKMLEGATYNTTSANILQQAVDCAGNCPPCYKDALVLMHRRREIDACFWLAKLAEYTDPEKLRLLEHAYKIAKDLKGYPLLKLEKLKSEFEKFRSGCLFVGGEYYSGGRTVAMIFAFFSNSSSSFLQVENLLLLNFV